MALMPPRAMGTVHVYPKKKTAAAAAAAAAE